MWRKKGVIGGLGSCGEEAGAMLAVAGAYTGAGRSHVDRYRRGDEGNSVSMKVVVEE